MCPCVAPHTAKIHTLITLGVAILAKSLVLKARKRIPRGFDSHRPLHFSLSGVSLRCSRARPSSPPSYQSLDAATAVPLIECVDWTLDRVCSRWSHLSVIDPQRTRANGCPQAALSHFLLRQRLGARVESPPDCDHPPPPSLPGPSLGVCPSHLPWPVPGKMDSPNSRNQRTGDGSKFCRVFDGVVESLPGLHALRLDNAHRGALGKEFEQSSGGVRRRGVCGDATFKVDVGLDFLRDASDNLDTGD